MGSIVSLLYFYKDVFGFKQSTKVNVARNKETNQTLIDRISNFK